MVSSIRHRSIAFFLVAIIAIFTAGLSACSDKSQSIKFIVRTGLESEGLRRVAEAFTRSTGVVVNIQEAGRDGYLSFVPNQLITGAADFDVAFIPSTIVAELAKAGALAPLNGRMNVDDPDLIATYGYEAKVYAVPTDISSMFLYYRKDLINNPPATWDEYLELGKKFTRALNPGSPTRYGAALPGMAGEDLPKAFYCVLWSYGGSIIEGVKVGIGEPQSVAAADFYRRLVDEGALPTDVTSWGFSQMFENLQNGELAMAAPFWNAAAPLILAGQSKFKDQIAYTVLPGVRQSDGTIKRASFQHAWTLAVNGRSKKSDLAARFIEFATGNAGGRLYAETARGNPARYSILTDPSLQMQRPDFKVLVESIKIAKAEPAVPYYSSLHNVMNEALTRVLTKSGTPKQAMDEARLAIERLIRSN